MTLQSDDRRPFGFFIHHQGRGHARRCEAILEHLDDRPVTIISADRSLFGALDDRVTFVELPDCIGDPSATPALHEQRTPRTMHCVPMGSTQLQTNAGLISRFLTQERPGLFVVDVSSEWAQFARMCSVPAVSMRMHGERHDVGHVGAYEASAAMVAPYDEALEQPDYPDWARARTFYSGGLCTTRDDVPTREAARARLGLPQEKRIVLAMSGGGGMGANYASLTMGARALPDALWLTIGDLYTEGHETDFANLRCHRWVPNPIDYLAAADVVIASAGDNTVHEIARVGRPYLCIPEWRYFAEQHVKGAQLKRLGAAHVLDVWPASNDQWRDAIEGAERVGTAALVPLFEPDAARRIAHHLIELDERLWAGAQDNLPQAPLPVAAE